MIKMVILREKFYKIYRYHLIILLKKKMKVIILSQIVN